MILELGMVVQVMRPCVDGFEGTSDGPIFTIVTVKSTDVKLVDDPWEAGALAKGAVMANTVWEVPLRRGVEGDGLTVAKPHQELCNHFLLLL